jgi:hypothetical protein
MTLLADLAESRLTTLGYFALPAEDLEKRYGAGKWSVRYLLHHLADSETVQVYRLRRVISEPRQVIWAYDQDAWAQRLDYGNHPLDLSERLFRASREAILHYAARHYERDGQLSAVIAYPASAR